MWYKKSTIHVQSTKKEPLTQFDFYIINLNKRVEKK